MDIIESGNPECEDLSFHWEIIDKCQYKCSYCYAKNSNDIKDNIATIKSVLIRLKRLDCKFDVAILGGEPTLHPKLLFIIEQLHLIDNCKSIELNTNFANNIEYFKQFDISKFNKIDMTISYHPEYKKGFIKKIKLLQNFNYLKYSINVNLSPNEDEWKDTKILLNSLNDDIVFYNFLFSTDNYKIKYNNNFYEYFKDEINRLGTKLPKINYTFSDHTTKQLDKQTLFKNELFNFKGFHCKALMYGIKLDGTIINTCTQKSVSLNLKRDQLIKYTVCPLNKCDCEIMYQFHKYREKVKK